ncbi:MAG: tetratricopeptide repeat protein [Cyanobacteria bacterium J06631_9]
MKYTWQLMLAGLLGLTWAGDALPVAAAVPHTTTLPMDDLSAIAFNSSFNSTDAANTTLPLSAETLSPLDLGRQHYSTGNYAAAVAAWQTARELSVAQDDLAMEALSLSYLSLAHQALNQWNEATTAVTQSIDLLEGAQADQIDSVLWAQVWNTQAALEYSLGQAESALALWEQSEEFYRQANDVSGQLGSQINQAQALQSLGFYRRSRQQLETVADELATLPDSALKVNGLRTLGNALQVLGDLTGSRAALFESANIAIAINSTGELSATYLSMGRTANDWGDTNAAISMFEEAKRAAITPADELQADLSRLRFYVIQGDAVKSAQIAADLAEQIGALPPSRLSVYGTVNMSASLAREPQLGQSVPIEQINQLLANAVQAARDLEDKQAEAYALNQWGSLYMQTQQWDDALTLTEKSLDIARAIDADDISSQSAWQLGRILKQQNKSAEAIVAYGEAVDALQALRGDLVAIDPDVQFSFRENVEPIYRELVSLLLAGNSSGVANEVADSGQKSNIQASGQPSQQNLAKAREVIEALQLAELDNFFQEACIDVESQQIDQVDPLATIIYPIILPG